jgi:hypothetical protein
MFFSQFGRLKMQAAVKQTTSEVQLKRSIKIN